MNKHTPGPWESSYRHDPITGAECAVWGADGDMVAMVFADLINDADGTATARLIAAAPDMLNTLQDIARYLGNRICRSDGEELILSRCRESIAKAQG